jgi:hypothetical protein
MASQYYARTKIQHGFVGGDTKTFEVGDQVEGLSKEDMVSLWEAGALTEVDPNARPQDDRDERIAQLEKELGDLKNQQREDAEAAAAEPLVVPEELQPDDDSTKTVEGPSVTDEEAASAAPSKSGVTTTETTPAKAPTTSTSAPAKAAPAKAPEAKGDGS